MKEKIVSIELDDVMNLSSEINQKLLHLCRKQENPERIVSCLRYITSRGKMLEDDASSVTGDVFIIEYLMRYEFYKPIQLVHYSQFKELFLKCSLLSTMYNAKQELLGETENEIPYIEECLVIKNKSDFNNYINNIVKLY